MLLENEARLSEMELLRLCEIVNSRLGFSYGPEKKMLIVTRLERRLRQLNIGNISQYIQRLQDDPLEVNEFIELLTTNVTSFFREKHQLEIVNRTILPVLKAKDRKVFCWSAGCSSGEEAYTLSMMFSDAFSGDGRFSILASDINVQKLKEAMKGVYSSEAVKDIPDNYFRRYFMPLPGEQESYQVRNELRRTITFRKINLNEEFDIPANIRFDIIFCRNVLIYFSKASREQLIDRFHAILNDGGYLVLGTCETMDVHRDPRWKPLKNSIFLKRV
ncbi:MAG TPA: protein-glutamate O-methyltransferase CheR [Bacillota bacterium]|nr:protein-glutamate O-methyltransferase CheR [Bacillota bacterium]HPT86794.1 protein-glutamate O-methyltransferase CheR [Bacillota bacterium]